ncbi:hypothetical protein Pmar_PMAR017237 [Perkinsus marinus ATCC 50983]|uniref:Uncharacterized protein n=1 Tax=Perkinsus marinus (strain ATCC 50983 / TXsc) TaxID=423536 RepID=C5LPW0_PERM5|nr:hypothetical protein Pmar_PMAR017237 [Perkinsus marinus ATCC 50983]EER01234.1 hypothetical protein Pmar_PMAR017237 [Perkinsus marinus ATCC 50983]|eukprot:XP_002768516.1 hypothetical protein Pmar_PMAR017237 [Perkinsus marinus ATCC 50983]
MLISSNGSKLTKFASSRALAAATLRTRNFAAKVVVNGKQLMGVLGLLMSHTL